jgi:hypothetical protein
MSSNNAHGVHPVENNQANQRKEDAEMLQSEQDQPVNMIAQLLSGVAQDRWDALDP